MKLVFGFTALLTALLTACGGGGGTTFVDAALDGPATDGGATGDHHRYVMDRQRLPTTSTEAREMGLDLNGDQTVDNQLGMVVSTLGQQGVDINVDVARLVDQGSILMLIDVQTTSFATASNVGFTNYYGATPSPTPCSGAGDVVCRRHLAGTGTFTIAAGSPREDALVGSIVAGTLTTPIGIGKLPVSLGAFGGVPLSLIGARTKLTGATATRVMTGIIAGGVPITELETKLYPRMQVTMTAQVAADCNDLGNPPTCGCADGSTGKTTLSLFDVAPKDCAITVDEIKNNSLVQSLFAPDLMIDGQEALSLGMSIDAVPASFTP